MGIPLLGFTGPVAKRRNRDDHGDSHAPIHVEDRALAHLKVVIATKLRRNESFPLAAQREVDRAAVRGVETEGAQGVGERLARVDLDRRVTADEHADLVGEKVDGSRSGPKQGAQKM